jgi:hypothetical protein
MRIVKTERIRSVIPLATGRVLVASGVIARQPVVCSAVTRLRVARRLIARPRVRLPSPFAVVCVLIAACITPGFLLAQSQADTEAGAPPASATAAADSAKTARDSTQAKADSTELATSSKARQDSLEAATEAAESEPEARVGPISYRTGYTLNRTTSNWDQNLSFGFSARGISVSTQTMGTLYADTDTKNDRRNSTSNLSVAYAASDRLSVGLDLSLSRLNDHFLRKQYNTDQVSARTAYSLPELDKLSATLTARAGSIDEVKPTYKGSGTTSSLTLDSKYAFALPCTLQVNASGELTNKRSQDVRTGLRTHDKDLKELVNATLSVIPLQYTNLRLGFSNSNSRLQYPLSGGQETWTSKSTIVDASLDVATKRQITLNATGRYRDSDVTYDVDKTKSSTFLSKSLSTQLNVPVLFGASFTSNFDIEYANSVMGSGRNGDINTRDLSGRIERRLTPAISSQILGSISLAQYFFYDPGSIGDDRDIYKDAVSVGLTLGAPGSAYSGSATIKRDLEELVYVRSMNSGNNRTAELYSATGSFVYRRGKLVFMQIASSTMDYTLFHFSENQNVLSRTTSISSSLDFPWADKASFILSHVYRIQDGGSYTTPEGEDHAVYEKTGGGVTEELYLVSEYRLTPYVNISVGQRFQQSRDFTFADGRKKFSAPRQVLDLLQNLSVAYKLAKNSAVQMTVSRTLSAFGTSYWNAAATFSRDFF